MFNTFYPESYVASAYTIDFEKMYEEGVRGLIFDIDNTLVPHGAPADNRAVGLFARLREIGFDTCLISNNQEPRVKPFADGVGSRYVHDAHKPSTKNYKKAMELMGTDERTTVFIGDQLFTDVWDPVCPCEADLPEGGGADRTETLSGEDRPAFLP